ncbi:MAG: retropepsin-like aspartic protease [Boseongicola sp.]|nr:retropepsin-like aspartic protease [Boseongicola sp.]
MATFEGTITNGQIIIVAAISVSGTGGNPTFFDALLDTGSQVTMISAKVVNAIGLQAIGHMSIIPVTGGSHQTKKYRARIDIPIVSQTVFKGMVIGPQNVLRGMDLDVGTLPYVPNNHDVLLGMDFLSAFHITLFGNRFILSN